jgi:cytochrome c
MNLTDARETNYVVESFLSNGGGIMKIICKRISLILAMTALVPAFAAVPEPQTKQAKEVRALVDKAVALVESKGKDAFGEFRKKGGAWFKGDLYIFIDDFKGNVVVYPPDAKLEGKNLLDMKDPNGTSVVGSFIEALKTSNSAWVEYLWPKPGSDKPVKKLTYVRKAKAPTGDALIVGSGFYPK